MHQRKRFDSINVVPFIDIMLVLLVIVLTTASFIQTGLIKVDLPNASAEVQKAPKKELKITIKSEGKIYFNKEIIAKEVVEIKLLSFEKDTPIHLYCDKATAFEHFVFLLDLFKKHQYENLGVVTENE